MDREKLKEIARQILDYNRNDHAQIISSLSVEEMRELTPLIKEVSDENIAREKAEHEAFMRRVEEKNRETREFIAETDKFIAEYDKFLADTERRLSRRKNSPSIYFPFAMGEA